MFFHPSLRTQHQRVWRCTLGALAALALGACGGGGGGADASTGTLRLALTDAPSCGYDAVHVTVEKIRVHQSSSASDNDPGWSEMVLSPARRVDLLTLTNGALLELGQMPLPAGKYTQLRFVLATNGSPDPLANSVVPTGSPEVALKTPSGQQSGVKTQVNIEVAANQMVDFVLDFDACKSIVTAGASGQYLLKPVVSVIPRYISGVTGYVQADAGASVSLQQNGEVVRATTPDATGRYLLQPVAPGSYTLVMSAPGRSTAVVTQVPVSANLVTSLGASGQIVGLPASPVANVQASAPVGSFVRALQPLASVGSPVEVQAHGVDSVTGLYTFTLPTSAPLVAPYAPTPTPLVFSAETSAAGRYTVQARLDGFADKQATLPTLSAGGSQTVGFTFP